MEIHAPTALTSRPRVTVVVPCYNYGRYLPVAVASVLAEPSLDVDVIIVDDASSDDSLAVARSLEATDERVRVIAHPANRGHIQTYNDGLEDARGDYLLLLSADDAVAHGALSRAVTLMEAHPSVGLVYGPAESFVDEVPGDPVPDASHWAVWRGAEWAAVVCRDGRNLVPVPSALVRADVHRKVGYYDRAHPHAGDLHLWLRLASAADVGHVSGTVQSYYREHGNNMHSQVFGTDAARGMVTDLEHRRAAFVDAAAGFPEGLRETLLRDADRALATQAMELAARAYVWGLTDTWPVDELVRFAYSTFPGSGRTRAGRALHRRVRAGAHLSRKNPLFVGREYWLRESRRREEAVIARVGLAQTAVRGRR